MSLKQYINERLHISSNTKTVRIKLSTKAELRSIIEQELKHQGPDADLNFIDVSGITDMSRLFTQLDIGNIKIDNWDTSNVKNMESMFENCLEFNCDLSGWDVRKVKTHFDAFDVCKKFESDLSKWDVRKVKYNNWMFDECPNMEAKPELQPKFN